MNAEERAALQSILDQIAPLRAYGLVGTEIRLELAPPDGAVPIPLGTIDDEGRLSMDALMAYVPIECAQA